MLRAELRSPLAPAATLPAAVATGVPPIAPAEPAPAPLAEHDAPAPTAPGPPEIPLEDLVNRASPAVVMIQAGNARGSGFFVSPDTVLTNVHVVTSNSSVTIRRVDGSTDSARVEQQSSAYDIAVLKVSNPKADQPTIPMGSAAGARVGQEVIAIGTPLGFLQNTVSRGIVSALRDVDGATVIQTDAAVNPGNSGGPLLNRSGIAIGIVRAGYSGREGLNFAVAIDHARGVIEGRAAPLTRSVTPSQYQPLSPTLAAPVDQRRLDATREFEKAVGTVAQRADRLDAQWRNFRGSCYEGRIAGVFDREWLALWDPRAMQGAVAPWCGRTFTDLKQTAENIRQSVVSVDEVARQLDVYPGTRRDLLKRYRLDGLVK